MLLGRALRLRVTKYSPLRAWFASSANKSSTKEEELMQTALKQKLDAVHVKVTDVSGGCGSMYDVEVASDQFAGQSRVQQHRMVNEILADEIKSMHGLTIRTMTLDQFQSKTK
ncbi:hypothetical protein PsorP6_017302 [Peronosclerospora sorghi]|uniref:Uncharacterized protein n=1 Tax=Peronosclerospora sorghi TaxID=230839 RepID=A0ACC0WKY8_9STRA|nr:hypothetical protein PsorP6_017302 [Peronosclerospora sorghi]